MFEISIHKETDDESEPQETEEGIHARRYCHRQGTTINGPTRSRLTSHPDRTGDRTLQDRFLGQAAGAVSDFAGREHESFDYVAAAVGGTGPKDALEGMIAVQMVAVHTLT